MAPKIVDSSSLHKLAIIYGSFSMSSNPLLEVSIDKEGSINPVHLSFGISKGTNYCLIGPQQIEISL